MDEITLRRLLFSKRLFNHGVWHSNKNTELDRFLAIHHFDNAAELFLKIVATKEDVIKRKPDKKDWLFKDLWNEIELQNTAGYKLPLKTQIFTLHDTRNLAQHQGDPPPFETVNKYQVYIKDFLIQCFNDIFEIDFDKIFASSLILDPKIKEVLIESEKYIGENNFKKSMESSAKAFHYLQINEDQDRSSKLGHITSSGHSFSWNLRGSSNSIQFDKNLKKFAEEINKQFNEIDRRLKESIRAIEEEFSLLKLGINYKEYKRFYEISPIVYTYISGMRIGDKQEEYYTEENALFCHEFVLDASLSLQGMTTK